MRLGILGGTFDPIHSGHLLLAEKAKAQAGLEQVLFVPAWIPPHKAALSDMTAPDKRYRMAELAVEGHADFSVSDLEFQRKNLSYTAQTLRSLKEARPQDELFFIIGEDSLDQMPKWREPGVIRSLATLVVAPRQKDIRKQEPGILWLEMETCPISSSEIRRRMAQDKKIPEGWLPPKVAFFIQNEGLYLRKYPCI